MLNLNNIDLKKEYRTPQEELSSTKSYIYQLVEELDFRMGQLQSIEGSSADIKEMADAVVIQLEEYTDSLGSTKANAGFGTADAADYNSLTIDGVYWIDHTVTTGNRPTSADGVLEVRTSKGLAEGVILQRFIRYNSDQIYWRMKSGETWTAWKYDFTTTGTMTAGALTVGNIDYTISDAEYTTLNTLIGSW